jgi:hypothetical protein
LIGKQKKNEYKDKDNHLTDIFSKQNHFNELQKRAQKARTYVEEKEDSYQLIKLDFPHKNAFHDLNSIEKEHLNQFFGKE